MLLLLPRTAGRRALSAFSAEWEVLQPNTILVFPPQPTAKPGDKLYFEIKSDSAKYAYEISIDGTLMDPAYHPAHMHRVCAVGDVKICTPQGQLN